MAGSIKTGYILGAGASQSAGYPLARDMPTAIEAFTGRLAKRPDTVELRAWCEETVEMMARERCETVDELAFVLRQRNGGQAVLKAKAVITALFLDLERDADLGAYRRLARAMIDFTDLGLPADGEMDVSTKAFCITYNYDRCFEAAIYQEVAASGRGREDGYSDSDAEVRVQRLINSGLDTMRERYQPIDTTRFTLLKMHGLVGTLWDDHVGPSVVRLRQDRGI